MANWNKIYLHLLAVKWSFYWKDLASTFGECKANSHTLVFSIIPKVNFFHFAYWVFLPFWSLLQCLIYTFLTLSLWTQLKQGADMTVYIYIYVCILTLASQRLSLIFILSFVSQYFFPLILGYFLVCMWVCRLELISKHFNSLLIVFVLCF